MQMMKNKSSCNFPLNTFVSKEHGEVLTFFRQGEVIRVKTDDISNYFPEIVTKTNDLGNIFFMENDYYQVLASSTSSSVIMYRF